MKDQPCWTDSAPAWLATPPAVPDRVDVVVIGAGYTGLSAARAVARGGASVAVFDKQAFGDGASARSGGQVRTGLRLGAAELVTRYGRPRAKVLFTASVDAISALQRLIADETIACDSERVGHVQAASKPAHFERFAREQEVLAREFDHHVDLVPRSLQDTELGAAGYHGLLVDARSLAIHPLKYLHGLARAAMAAGARLHDRMPVTRVSRTGVGFQVTAAGRKIVARDVIACTNGYTDGALPALRRRVMPIGSHVIATEPLSAELAAQLIPRRRVVFDSDDSLHYFRLSPDNRLVFGGRAQFASATPARTRTSAIILRRAMVELFPALRDVRVDYAWSGNMDFTRDSLPHAGLVDGIHYAIGYGGQGIALATYLGARVGECLLGRQADTPFHDLRFDAIPLYAGLYYQWRNWTS
jgi:glycine/D-amino acid oxidase-like deaminating enzyme